MKQYIFPNIKHVILTNITFRWICNCRFGKNITSMNEYRRMKLPSSFFLKYNKQTLTAHSVSVRNVCPPTQYVFIFTPSGVLQGIARGVLWVWLFCGRHPIHNTHCTITTPTFTHGYDTIVRYTCTIVRIIDTIV